MHWIKRHIAVVLFILVVVVGFVLSPGIGSAWDEPDNMFSGGVYLNFFRHHLDPVYFRILTDKASAFGDRIIPNDHLMAHLPPVHNYVGVLFVLAAEVLHIASTAPVIIIAWHLATVVFFALLVATTYRFGLLLGLSRWASIFAAILVFLYPQTFGHGLSNSKDTAQASLFILSLYYLVRGSLAKGKGIKDICIGAVVWGLALATKFNAVYVPVIWGIWMFAGMQSSKIPLPASLSRFISHIVRVTYCVLIVTVIGVVVAIAVWPYLWFDTLSRVAEVIGYFTTVGQGYRILWNGADLTIGSGVSYWWYPWTSFIYGTPLLLLFSIIIGTISVFRGHVRPWVRILLVSWIVVPMIRTLFPWSAYYDQLRHFMEILPPMMLIAAVGIDRLLTRPILRRIAIVFSICIALQLLVINVVYFPYSTGYYNIFAGNPNVKFDRDIEGLSIKEGMDWAHTTYGHINLWAPIAAHLSWYYLLPNDQYDYWLTQADTVIVINKQSHKFDTQYKEFENSKSAFTLVHTVRRGDAVFGWVYRATTAVK